MEAQMKAEIIEDLKLHENRILLHEERVEDGKFLVVPVWDHACVEDIETPLDVYNSIAAEGYRCDYLRIPMYCQLTKHG